LTLEELIRDRAAKGELVHLSVVHSALDSKWHAIYAPAHVYGVENGAGADPVEALIAALTSVKSSRKRVTAAVTERENIVFTDEENKAKIVQSKKAGKLAIDGWE